MDRLRLRFSGAAALVAAALTGCDSSSSTRFDLSKQRSDDAPYYVIYNYSGATVMAATIEDSAGGQGNLDRPIPNEEIFSMGKANRPDKPVYSIALQWIPGEGRVRWLRAELPVKVDERNGGRLEVYLRPDRLVCARLFSADAADPARVDADARSLSCTKPRQMPEPVPGAASAFKFDQVSHSWARYDRLGESTVTYQRLWHANGQVRLRYGEGFRGGPWFLDEFYSVRVVGDNAALLVEAPIAPAKPAFYLVLAEPDGWSSRLVGQVSGVAEEWVPLSDSRVHIGSELIVDTRSAVLFRLPYFSGYMSILGQSDDGNHVAIYFRTADHELRQGQPLVSQISAMRLEDGHASIAARDQLPNTAAKANVFTTVSDWYRKNCRWVANAEAPLDCGGTASADRMR